MDRGTLPLTFALVIILALILQVVLIIADNREIPAKAATEFTTAYFKLESDMAEHLCKELTEEAGSDVVGDYLNRVADKAGSMGFTVVYMKNVVSHIETTTEMEDENTARVTITANRSRYLNPIFGVIAKLFFLTETHEIDETLSLVKENGQWKVCGAPFSLLER
jgi:hypothetical protein